MSTETNHYPISLYDAQGILRDLVQEQRVEKFCDFCNEELDECWVCCTGPLAKDALCSTKTDHVVHMACSKCKSDPLAFVGQGGRCIRCLSDLNGRRSAIYEAGMALQPPVKSAKTTNLIRCLGKAELEIQAAQDEKDDERRREGASRRAEAVQALHEKQEQRAAEAKAEAARKAQEAEEELAARKLVLEAEAKANAERLEAEAQANAERLKADAEVNAKRLEAEAQANAERAKAAAQKLEADAQAHAERVEANARRVEEESRANALRIEAQARETVHAETSVAAASMANAAGKKRKPALSNEELERQREKRRSTYQAKKRRLAQVEELERKVETWERVYTEMMQLATKFIDSYAFPDFENMVTSLFDEESGEEAQDESEEEEARAVD